MSARRYAGTAVRRHGDGREQETRAILGMEQPDSANYAGLATRALCRRGWRAAWQEDEDFPAAGAGDAGPGQRCRRRARPG
jgi:hypothetical protein